MTLCKTAADHLRSLQDGRTVYIDGELAGDVTVHPAFRNSVHSAAELYDVQANDLERMTFVPDDGSNRSVSRAWQMPKTLAETIERRKALTAWAEHSFGFMGRSPDHVASALVGQRMGLEVFARRDPARAKAFAEYFNYARSNDLFLTYVIINPQADRSKDWGEQSDDLVAKIVDEDHEGITIRGAKMLGTSSIMANEVFVANLQPLKAGEEAIAFSCALPMNAKGLRVLSRKSYEAEATSVYDNPISSRYDENDALIYFDDVKVPWERVFACRDVELCRAQFHDTPGHIYQNYQAQIRLAVKLRFLVGIARKLTETIGTSRMPAVQEHLGRLAANAGMVEAMLLGIEAGGEQVGEYWVPNRHLVYSAQVITQDLYPKIINTIRELAGGAFIMLPSSFRDWGNPEIAPIIRKTQRSGIYDPENKVKFLKTAWDAVGSEFGSRHQQYEMFYAGAQFVTAGHSFRCFDWGRATGLVDRLMSGVALADAFGAEPGASRH